MKCDKCHSQKITYYKQQRKDGLWIVTARCENDHHPITGKPFYPISKFDLSKLPVLGQKRDALPPFVNLRTKQKQIDLTEHAQTIMEFFEQRQRRCDFLFPRISTFKRLS